MNADSQSKEIFDENYFLPYIDDPKRVESYRLEKKKIEQFIPNGKILDYGCGIGGFLDTFSSDSWEKVGVDISNFAIRKCKKRGIDARIIEPGFLEKEEMFDVIVLRGVWQHLRDPFGTVENLKEHLRPQGIFAVLMTPNINSSLFRKTNRLPALTRELCFNLPSDVQIIHTLERNGLEAIAVTYPYFGSPYSFPSMDFVRFLMLGFFKESKLPAFPRSMVNILARGN